MGINDLVSYVTMVGETLEVETDDIDETDETSEGTDQFEALQIAFDQSFVDLADVFFEGVTQNITYCFEFAAANPLCVVLVSCVLVVLAFRLFYYLLHIFR